MKASLAALRLAGDDIELTDNAFVEIIPVGVAFLDQANLPRAIPAFDLLLARDRDMNVVELFVPDEKVDAISFGKTRNEPIAMLERASSQIAGDAGIKRSVAPTGENVDVVGALHTRTLSEQVKFARKTKRFPSSTWVPFPHSGFAAVRRG